jgi:membrane protein DedA with SNARE-associated domain
MDSIIQTLHSLPPWGVLGMLFAFAFIENIFPPSPSDLIVVAGGTLIGIGTIGLLAATISTTAGSILGFLVAFYVGRLFGRKIIEAKRMKWISLDAVHKVERWFRTYGYAIIVVNRFLSGTRAVVSVVAGMSEMRLLPTALLCGVSALIWNVLLLWGGMELGQNWRQLEVYLDEYSRVAMITAFAAILLVVVRFVLKKRVPRVP